MERNIFYRLEETRAVRAVRPFYEKHREFILFLLLNYLFAFISIGLFWLFTYPLQMDPLAANVVSWAIRIVLSYLLNRVWVFAKDKAQGAKGIALEAAAFVLSKLSTLAVEELILAVGINLLGQNKMVVKITAQVLVFFFNYFLTRVIVFRRKPKEEQNQNESTEEESNA